MNNQISKKVNSLASNVMPEEMLTNFIKGDLDCRIMCLSMIAAQVGDTKIVAACEEWITVI